MTVYLIKRLVYRIPIVFGVLLVTFALFNIIGGDVSQHLAGGSVDQQTIEEIRREYGLDKPLFFAADSQFINHFKRAVTFDFGRAYDSEPVISKIKRGIVPSLALTVPMFCGTVFVSIVLSMILSVLYRTKWDSFGLVLCVVGMSLPYLAFIIFGQYFFAYKLGWFELFYSPDVPLSRCLILPILIGIVAGLGRNVRFYRAVILDELSRDYVRTAYAKGLSSCQVLRRHVLKNIIIPVITNLVLTIPYLFLGSFLLERFFGIPGLGYLMVEAVGSRDFAVVNALTYLMALLFIIFNLLADICYALVDTRVRLD